MINKNTEEPVEEVEVERDGVDLTQERAPKKKRRPGGGRKPKESTLYKRSQDLLAARHPEILDEMIRQALAQPVTIKCPVCGSESKHAVGAGNKELLMHLDNRIQGKPKAVTEVDLRARVSLSNADLVKLSIAVRDKVLQFESLPIEALEAMVRELPVNTAIDNAPVLASGIVSQAGA